MFPWLDASVHKVPCPVFFSGHIGTPRRKAVCTVVQGASHIGTLWAVLGFHQIRTPHRSAQLHLCCTGNPPVVWATVNQLPLAVLTPADMDNTHPMGSDFLTHFIRRAFTVDIQRRPLRMDIGFIN